jgi:ParB-like chromosome segregation protein Spo0J
VADMSMDSKRQAWTRFVEGREREAKRPRAKNRVKEEASQAELDDLVTDSDRRDAKR